jgi:hypothetical protein
MLISLSLTSPPRCRSVISELTDLRFHPQYFCLIPQYSHESVLAKRPSATVMAAQHTRRVGFPFRAHSGRENIS